MLLNVFVKLMNWEQEKICDICLSKPGLICLIWLFPVTTHLPASNTTLYLWLEENFHMYINYTFLIQLSAIGYLGWFHVTAFVTSVALNSNKWVTPWCTELEVFSKNPGVVLLGHVTNLLFCLLLVGCFSVGVVFCFVFETLVKRALERLPMLMCRQKQHCRHVYAAKSSLHVQYCFH